MSELASTSAATPAPSPSSTSASTASTPVSTHDVASNIVSDVEDTGDLAATETPASPSNDDFDAEPAERVDAIGRVRVTSIPHPRVKQMIEKREQKLIAAVAKELGITKAAAELKLDDVLAGLKERGTKLTDFEGRLRHMDSVEAIIANDPDRFMQMLAQVDPRYAAYAKQQQQQAAHAQQRAGDEDSEPQPDYDLGNGQRTYSVEGLQKLRAWERRQVLKEVENRVKPFEERIKQDTERAATEKMQADMRERVNQQLERARKWPQFAEHEADILKALQNDRSIGLEDAYMQVVVPRLAGDRTKLRQEVVAEINAQPKTSSVTTTTAPKPADNKPKTTADVAREVIASFEK